MKKVLKGLGILLALVLMAAGGFVLRLALKKPDSRPPSGETIERTPGRLARGEYLVVHLSDCLGCHSDHVWEKFGAPVRPGTEGQGGFAFDEKFAVPGIVCAQNITPDPETGLGKWTDGEVLRAFREGVDRDGKALFPMMPYAYFREMSDEDAKSVVVYLRSLRPVRHAVPKQDLRFPVNLFIKSAPRPAESAVETPRDARDHPGYGKYLVTIGGCRECHTAHDAHGQRIPGRDFAGGWLMPGPWGRVVTANITPDPDTFMGRATKQEFIGRFRSFAGFNHDTSPVAPKGRNTLMPWLAYAGLTDGDLGAIYDYLKTVPPIQNHVEPFPDAAPGPAPTMPAIPPPAAKS